MLVVAAMLFTTLLAVGRTPEGRGRLGRPRQVGRVLPERVALVAGALVVAWLTWGLVTGVVG